MDKDEYIIINKTAIQKRIEELEKDPINFQWKHNIRTHNGHSPQQREKKKQVDLELDILRDLLSQSTPLIPEIEKAMNAAREIQDDSAHDTFTAEDISGCTEVCTYGWRYKITNKDYISTLKLDI